MTRLCSAGVGVALFLLTGVLGGGCGKIVGIHDTVYSGAGGTIAAGNGGVGGDKGTGNRGGGPGGAGGVAIGSGTGGVSSTAGMPGSAGTPGTAAGGTIGAAGANAGSGGGGLPTGSGGAPTGSGGAPTGSGGAIGGRGAIGSGGVATGGVVGTGGVSTGGSMGSGGIPSATGGKGGGGPVGSGGVTTNCQGSTTQCSGSQVQTCVAGQFSMPMDCSPHQTCSGTACACIADPACRAVGAICASSSTLGTCANDGSCFYQSSPAVACASGTVCERLAPASCADPTWAEWPIPPPSPSAYTDNQNGTVTDNVTGLIWQSPPAATPMSQAAALSYCTQSRVGGYSDWRLPTKIELASIVDSGRASVPTINNIFPMTVADFYWTSTIFAQTPANAWFVNFQTGGVGFYDLTAAGNVRCVR